MVPSNGNLALLLRPLLPSVSERVCASRLGCDLPQKNASGHHRSLPKFQWLSPTVVYSLLTQSTCGPCGFASILQRHHLEHLAPEVVVRGKQKLGVNLLP